MNNDLNTELENLSALADGQLQGEALARTMQWVSQHAEVAQNVWAAYHAVGEALRGTAVPSAQVDAAFLDRWRQKVSQESNSSEVIDTPIFVATNSIDTRASGQKIIKFEQKSSANDSQFRVRAVAGLASLALVAGVSWFVAGNPGGGAAGSAGPVMAHNVTALPDAASVVATGGTAAAKPVAAAALNGDLASLALTPDADSSGQPQVMLRDARLDALLAAHKQWGGAPALQSATGFMRNATYEDAQR